MDITEKYKDFHYKKDKIVSNLLRSQIFLPMGLDLLNYNIIFTDNLPASGVACTDFERIYINPESPCITQSSNSQGKLAFLLIHEVLHILLKHNTRVGTRDIHLWRLACDFMINLFAYNLSNESQQIESKIITMPFDEVMKEACFDEDFSNMIEEEIYDKLQKDGKYTNKTSEKSLKEFLQEVGLPTDGVSEDLKIKVTQVNLKYKGKNFSHVEIEFPKIELSKDQQEKQENRLSLSRSMLENTLLSRGLESSSFQRFLKKLFDVKIDWKIILRDAILTELEKSPDLCWGTPRMSWLANPELPYLANFTDQEKYGTIIFGIDESGSINDEDVQKAIDIIRQSKEFFKNIYVIKHDTDIWTKLYEELSQDDVNDLLQRRKCGGTSHKEVYNEINNFIKKNNNEYVSLCIFITDMCSDIIETQNIISNTIPRIYLVPDRHQEITGVVGKVIQIR